MYKRRLGSSGYSRTPCSVLKRTTRIFSANAKATFQISHIHYDIYKSYKSHVPVSHSRSLEFESQAVCPLPEVHRGFI